MYEVSAARHGEHSPGATVIATRKECLKQDWVSVSNRYFVPGSTAPSSNELALQSVGYSPILFS